MSTYHAEPNRSEPEQWVTKSYTVRRPGNTAFSDQIARYSTARDECALANRAVMPGHHVFAEQEYVGEIAALDGYTRTIEVA